MASADTPLTALEVGESWNLNHALLEHFKKDEESSSRDKIEQFFPIQIQAIPLLLAGQTGVKSRDLLISAPTGSGKTLVYVLPIVQKLLNRVVCRLRALIVVPSRDLAVQVKEVVDRFCKNTPLRCGIAIGQNTFSSEQHQLVGRKGSIFDKLLSKDGGSVDSQSAEQSSLVDILVATPGRLVDHIEQTPGFTLQHLQFLIVDEADRLLNQSYQNWISKIYDDMYPTGTSTGAAIGVPRRLRDGNPFSRQTMSAGMYVPLCRVLLSATLTRNPRKLAAMGMHNPQVITVGRSTNLVEDDGDGDGDKHKQEGLGEDDEIIASNTTKATDGKMYATPETLTELMIECKTSEHPLVLIELLHMYQGKQVMVFTSSLNATHRLTRLLQAYFVHAPHLAAPAHSADKSTNQTPVREYSSSLSQKQRTKLARECKEGNVPILVCSDVIARGIDVHHVEVVINYDVPSHLKTYIHRVGRTARAGRKGTCVTIVKQGQKKAFFRLLKKADSSKVESVELDVKRMKTRATTYKKSLKGLEHVLEMEENGELSRTQPIPGSLLLLSGNEKNPKRSVVDSSSAVDTSNAKKKAKKMVSGMKESE